MKKRRCKVQKKKKKREGDAYTIHLALYIYIGKDKVIDIAVSLAILLVFDKTTVMV